MGKKCEDLIALECELSFVKDQIARWEDFFLNSKDDESVESEKSEEIICNISDETETIEMETVETKSIEIETIDSPLPHDGEISNLLIPHYNDGSTTEINIFLNYPIELIIEIMSYLNDTDVLYLSHCNVFFRATIIDCGLLKYHLNRKFSRLYMDRNYFPHSEILYNGRKYGKYVCINLIHKDVTDLEVRICKYTFINTMELRLDDNYTSSREDYRRRQIRLETRDLVYLSHLKKLSLNGCDKLASLSPLANIETLELDTCFSATDFYTLFNVRHLTLKLCLSLRNSDLEAFANFPQLESLEIKFCPKITSVKCLGKCEGGR